MRQTADGACQETLLTWGEMNSERGMTRRDRRRETGKMAYGKGSGGAGWGALTWSFLVPVL